MLGITQETRDDGLILCLCSADRVRGVPLLLQLRGAGEDERGAFMAGALRHRLHLHHGLREDEGDRLLRARGSQVTKQGT